MLGEDAKVKRKYGDLGEVDGKFVEDLQEEEALTIKSAGKFGVPAYSYLEGFSCLLFAERIEGSTISIIDRSYRGSALHY